MCQPGLYLWIWPFSFDFIPGKLSNPITVNTKNFPEHSFQQFTQSVIFSDDVFPYPSPHAMSKNEMVVGGVVRVII